MTGHCPTCGQPVPTCSNCGAPETMVYCVRQDGSAIWRCLGCGYWAREPEATTYPTGWPGE